MKGNIDCPNIQGWVAIRVYGPQASIPQETSNSSSSNEKKQENQIQELFEFTKCFLTIEVRSSSIDNNTDWSFIFFFDFIGGLPEVV